jgi:hypothetical protein
MGLKKLTSIGKEPPISDKHSREQNGGALKERPFSRIRVNRCGWKFMQLFVLDGSGLAGPPRVEREGQAAP